MLAADVAVAAGETDRARVVYEFAIRQWVRIDRHDEIAATRERLAGL